jgi:hypothetical protein
MTHDERTDGVAFRDEMIELRNGALEQADFKWAVILSHVVKWMSDRLAEDNKELLP